MWYEIEASLPPIRDCVSLTEGSVLFWGANWIASIQGDTNTVILENLDAYEIADINQDASGRMWLLTRTGQVFSTEAGIAPSDWRLEFSLDLDQAYYLSILNDLSAVLIADLNGLYKFQLSNLSNDGEKILELGDLEFIREVIRDPITGDLIIITSSSIAELASGNPETVEIPSPFGRIDDVVFDTRSQTIYIFSGDGLFIWKQQN
jgi:hypothetical protein